MLVGGGRGRPFSPAGAMAVSLTPLFPRQPWTAALFGGFFQVGNFLSYLRESLSRRMSRHRAEVAGKCLKCVKFRSACHTSTSD